MDYVFAKGGSVYLSTNNLSLLLEHDMTLTPQLTVLTNGTIKVRGAKDQKLIPGRKLTLDGFWFNEDGLLAHFPPHYIDKDRGLYFVDQGVYHRVDQEIVFNNGVHLRPDATVVSSEGKLIRLQDGQGVTMEGTSLPALDHIMVIKGKLVLQKDGSLIGLPAGVMGMSDGSKVTPQGLVTLRSGEQILLKEGERLTLPGTAMPEIN